MAALASILYEDGYEVAGSDVEKKLLTDDNLLEKGIHIYKLNDKEYLKYDLVIIGHDFINESLIEELYKNKILYFEYHQFLDYYLDNNKLISICGSHGKTTLVNILGLLNPNCSYLRGDGEGKKLELDKYFFLESCEYKNHFLTYNPKEIIITNIDYDHIDFFKTKKQYINAFNNFAQKSNKIYINYSDRKKIKHHNKITFGRNKRATYNYKIIEEISNKVYISIFKKSNLIINLELYNYGDYFLELIVGAIAFMNENNISLKNIEKSMQKYTPARQRFEQIIIGENVIILDYAHHPKQILNNYKIISKKYKKNIKIAIFRGDRFSRIFYFKKDIIKALKKYDYAFVLPLPNMKENEGKTVDVIVTKKIKKIQDISEIDYLFSENKKYSISLMSSKPFFNEIEYLKSKF